MKRKKGRKEGNVLFNDTIFMEKDHSDSERGNPLPSLYGLVFFFFFLFFLFLISSNGYFMHHPRDKIILSIAFVTPVVEH